MIEITYLQTFVFITAVWILIRVIAALKNKTVSVKRELLLLLVYICLIVIARFVYFGFHLVDGKIDPFKIDLSRNADNKLNLIPFFSFSTDTTAG